MENFGMKKFRNYQPDQLLLLPPALNDWVPEGHLSSFISDVVDALDLGEIYAAYDETNGGQPPYHPLLMTKLLVYGYCTGVRSSRQIERATWENVPFRVLAADQHPDHDTLAAFRKRHLKALGGLFQQVLNMALTAGIVDLEHVSVDGSKIGANAARGKTASYTKVVEREKRLKAYVEETLADAERIDAQEDEKYGAASNLELKGDLAKRQFRLAKIQELKARMEEEQKQIEEAEKAKAVEKEKNRKGHGRGGRKRKQTKEGATEKDKDDDKESSFRRNPTDYDSRLMRQAGSGWGQSYNAQAVVDSKAQVIVASAVTNEGNDRQQLVPMLVLAKARAGRAPKIASADAGYSSNDQVTSNELKDIDLLVPPGQKRPEKEGRTGKQVFPPTQMMIDKLQKPVYKALYKLRKIIVEPVFGQIKEANGFRRFSFRGLDAVRSEWDLVSTTHNLQKLYRSGWKPAH
jgi:transposase